MVRNERQRARSQERKLARLAEHTHGGYGGKSLLERVEDQLLKAACHYVEEVDPRKKLIARGELRGLARAVAIITVPYGSMKRNIPKIEADYVSQARRSIRAREQEATHEERAHQDSVGLDSRAG